MTTKIEWRLRAVTRYQLTRYEYDDAPQASDGLIRGTTVEPAGEFDSLYLAMKIGNAMALAEVAPPENVEFDAIHLPAPKVRAKMRCSLAQPHRDSAWQQDRDGGNVMLSAVYENGAADGGNAAIENRVFSKATPCATVQMQIDNPDAFSRFKPGQDYYVDFIPVPKPDDLPTIEA